LIARLSGCSAAQQALFLGCCLDRALRAFADYRPSDPRLGALRAGLDAALTRLPSGAVQLGTLPEFERAVEELLQASAADGDEGEPKDRVGFYFAAAAHLFLGVASGKLTDPEQAALCASHVIHIREQVYDNDAIDTLEKRWQTAALDALRAGAATPEAL